jgi:hypothetical protein
MLHPAGVGENLAFNCNIHVNSEFKISDQDAANEVDLNPYWRGERSLKTPMPIL